MPELAEGARVKVARSHWLCPGLYATIIEVQPMRHGKPRPCPVHVQLEQPAPVVELWFAETDLRPC